MKFSMKKFRRRVASRPRQMVLELLEDRTLMTAPAVVPIADQYVPVTTGFVLGVNSFDLDEFTTPGSDPVTLSARLADGGLLPGWLSFSAGLGTGTGTFTSSGTVGSIDVIVTATDSTGATGTDTFTIVATEGTLTVANPIANQTAGIHTPFTLSALGVFADTDGNIPVLTATLANGKPLPAWLTFTPSAGSGTFTGTPLDGDIGAVDVKLTATDPVTFAATIDLFSIIVPLNHTPQFTKGADQVQSFSGNPQSVTTAWGTDIYEGPPEEYEQSLSFVITTDNDAMFDVLPKVVIDETQPHPLSGTLTYTLKAGATGTANVTVRLKDNGGSASGGVDTSDAQLFVIAVTDSTDLNLTLVNPIPNQTIGVHAPLTLSASGVFLVGDGDLVTLSATKSDGSALPAWLTFTPGAPSTTPTGTFSGTPLDADIGSINVTLKATDPSGNVATNTFTISVPLNRTPQFTKGADQTALEDSGTQSVAWATNILTGPPVEAGQVIDFIVTTNNDALFSVLPAIAPNGTLTYTPALNANGVATVTVRVHDNGGNASGGVDTSDPQTFTITIGAVNDAPSFTKGADVTVLEDAGGQSVSTWASNINPGANEATQIVNFTVTNDNNGLFSVQPTIASDGTLTFQPALNANGSATITVTAVDDGGTLFGGVNTSVSQTFLISVTPVNDAPSLTIIGNPTTINEEDGLQTIAGFVSSVSKGPANELSQVITNYTISQTASTSGLTFSTAPSIDPVTGTLTYQATANSSGTATFTVSATDDGGTTNGGVDTSATQTFIISVTGVNDTPTFTLTGNPPAVLEDAGLQIVAGFASNISAGAPNESGQTLTFTVTPVSTDGLLFDLDPTVDPVTGNLTYTASANSYGTATFSLILSDNGGGADTSIEQFFTITVTAVNDAPTFTIAGNPATILEDAGLQTIANFVTSVSVGPTNESTQAITNYTVTQLATTGGLTFLTAPFINPNTGTLTYQAAANANGTATLSVTVTDNGGTTNGGSDTSTTLTFIITVTAVNDVPSFLIAANPAPSLEDAGLQIVPTFATNISAGAPNESGQILTFNLTQTSTTGGLTFFTAPSIDPVTGNLVYQADLNANGTATYRVTLSDNGGGTDTSAAQFFTIFVTAVNDAPTFILSGNPATVNEDSGPQSVAAFVTGVSPGAANESSQSLTLNLLQISSTGSLTFLMPPTIDPLTGVLTYQADPDANGSATFSVTLMDNGGTANGGSDTSFAQVFTITITPVNDEPSFTISGNPPTVVEDAGTQTVLNFATNINHGAANESNQILSFIVTQTGVTGGLTFETAPTINTVTGTLTYRTTADLSGTATFNVTLMDNGGTANGGDDTSSTQTFTITVLSINDAPTFSQDLNWSDLEVAVNDGPYTITDWVKDMSPGPLNEASQLLDFIVTTNNPGLFSVLPQINVTTGTLTFTPLDGFGGTATVTVKLHDNGGTANGGVDTSLAQTFVITSVVRDLVYTSAKSAQIKASVVNGQLKVSIGGVPYSSYQTAHVETLTLNGGSNNDVINLTGLSPDVYPKLKTIIINGNAGKDAITMNASSTNAFSTMLTVSINGGTGNDVINLAALPGGLFPNITSFEINGDAGNDAIYGSESAETISGGDGNDTIRGGAGNDSLLGGAGNDIIQGGVGNDSVDGGAGNDSIAGQSGDDSLLGGDGNDTILGGLGNDTLKGGLGNDLLIGGAGIDNIDGEGGKDTALGGKGSAARGGTSHSDLGDIISAEIINEAFSKLFSFE